MKSSFLLFLLMVLNFNLRAQEVETIKLVKNNYVVYKGVLKETESWYFFDNEGVFYLANIDASVLDIYGWFEKFKDSQNIYKANQSLGSSGMIGGNDLNVLEFVKDNDPENRLSFYFDKTQKNVIVLTYLIDQQFYTFQKLDQ